ncbi:hypothetical protein ACVWZR_007030 [Bradyrhizobium sp. i1.3.1]
MAAPIKFGVGQSVLRKEDDALIRGKGRYTDDYAPQAALRCLMLRSPHAHAKYTIDASRARTLPGVALILTADDVKDLGNLPCLFNLETDPFTGPPYPILAKDEVRHVGDSIAFVVAETIDQARDAIEAIEVKWRPAAGRDRRRQRGQEGRAAGLAGQGRQRAVRRLDRRQGGDRSCLCQSACGGRDLHRQSARGRELHGGARGGLRIRRQARSSDADGRQPGQPSPARHPLPERAQHPDREDAGDLPRRRRWVRHQAVSVPRIRLDGGRRAAAQESSEMGGRPHRALHGRRAGPRQRHHRPRWRWPRTENSSRWIAT